MNDTNNNGNNVKTLVISARELRAILAWMKGGSEGGKAPKGSATVTLTMVESVVYDNMLNSCSVMMHQWGREGMSLGRAAYAPRKRRAKA